MELQYEQISFTIAVDWNDPDHHCKQYWAAATEAQKQSGTPLHSLDIPCWRNLLLLFDRICPLNNYWKLFRVCSMKRKTDQCHKLV